MRRTPYDWHPALRRIEIRRARTRRLFNHARRWFWPIIAAALTFMLLNPGVWPK
jgi:hypothetical protein